jgi:hypothetical protein
MLASALSLAALSVPRSARAQAETEVERRPVDRLAGFYSRKAMGNGTFLGPEELAKRPVARTSDLMRLIPGMRVSTRSSAATPVTSAQCSTIGYFVDGIRARGYNPIDSIDSQDILAIEIYKNPAQVPITFQADDLCAAIVIWTRGG